MAVANRPAAFRDDCRLATVVVSRFRAPNYCRTQATVIDRGTLSRGGAHALYRMEDGPGFRIEAAYPGNRRPFMPPATDEAPQ